MTGYVGIDPSITNTGIVILGEDGGLLGCANSRAADDKRLEPILRYGRISEAVVDAMFDVTRGSGYATLIVGYEDYSFGSVHRSFALAEFGGILKKSLYDAGVKSIQLFAPTWNKKFATRDGMASKERMQEQAMRECPAIAALPRGESTSDVCDAYFLAKAAWYAGEAADAIVRCETNKALLRSRLEMMKEWKKAKAA